MRSHEEEINKMTLMGLSELSVSQKRIKSVWISAANSGQNITEDRKPQTLSVFRVCSDASQGMYLFTVFLTELELFFNSAMWKS